MIAAHPTSAGDALAVLGVGRIDRLAEKPLDASSAYLEIARRERDLGGEELRKLGKLIQTAGIRMKARVADVGSGHGWHAHELSRWFDVVGIEPDPALVAQARAARGEVAAFVRADAQRLPLAEHTLDLAYLLNTSLGYGGEAADRRALRELRRVLEPGAPLVIEAVSASLAEAGTARIDRFPDGARVLREPTFNPLESRLFERETVLLTDGSWGAFGYDVRAYAPEELEQLVREEGFRAVTIRGSLDGRPWTDDDPVVLRAQTPS